MNFISRVQLIRKRRRMLANSLLHKYSFDFLEESMVPAYCNDNFLASYVAWARLLKLSDFINSYADSLTVLDFGSGSGEILDFFDADTVSQYNFIESNSGVSDYLSSKYPKSNSKSFQSLNVEEYDLVLALDSLEHNDNWKEIIDVLLVSLKKGGRIIVSGPTENAFYKIGRFLAGYSGDYHHCTVYEIERYLSEKNDMGRVALIKVFRYFNLFRISVWVKK